MAGHARVLLLTGALGGRVAPARTLPTAASLAGAGSIGAGEEIALVGDISDGPRAMASLPDLVDRIHCDPEVRQVVHRGDTLASVRLRRSPAEASRARPMWLAPTCDHPGTGPLTNDHERARNFGSRETNRTQEK